MSESSKTKQKKKNKRMSLYIFFVFFFLNKYSFKRFSLFLRERVFGKVYLDLDDEVAEPARVFDRHTGSDDSLFETRGELCVEVRPVESFARPVEEGELERAADQKLFERKSFHVDQIISLAGEKRVLSLFDDHHYVSFVVVLRRTDCVFENNTCSFLPPWDHVYVERLDLRFGSVLMQVDSFSDGKLDLFFCSRVQFF